MIDFPTPVLPAGLKPTLRPTPRVAGQTLGPGVDKGALPLTGAAGADTMSGGIRDDATLAPPAGGAPAADAVPTPPPRPSLTRRPRIIPAGAKNFAQDVAYGVTSAPSASPITAAAGGLLGALQSRQGRLTAEQAATIAAEDRAAAAEQTTWERDYKERELAAKEKGGYFTKDTDASDAYKYVDASGQLTPAGVTESWDMAREWGDSQRSVLAGSSLTGSKVKTLLEEINRQERAYLDELQSAMRNGKLPLSVAAPAPVAGEGGPAPGGEAATPEEPAPPPAGISGSGLKSDPYAGFKTAEEVYKHVRPGEYYYDPDGNLRYIPPTSG